MEGVVGGVDIGGVENLTAWKCSAEKGEYEYVARFCARFFPDLLRIYPVRVAKYHAVALFGRGNSQIIFVGRK